MYGRPHFTEPGLDLQLSLDPDSRSEHTDLIQLNNGCYARSQPVFLSDVQRSSLMKQNRALRVSLPNSITSGRAAYMNELQAWMRSASTNLVGLMYLTSYSHMFFLAVFEDQEKRDEALQRLQGTLVCLNGRPIEIDVSEFHRRRAKGAGSIKTNSEKGLSVVLHSGTGNVADDVVVPVDDRFNQNCQLLVTPMDNGGQLSNHVHTEWKVKEVNGWGDLLTEELGVGGVQLKDTTSILTTYSSAMSCVHTPSRLTFQDWNITLMEV